MRIPISIITGNWRRQNREIALPTLSNAIIPRHLSGTGKYACDMWPENDPKDQPGAFFTSPAGAESLFPEMRPQPPASAANLQEKVPSLCAATGSSPNAK
jgi:hypothetical protein